MSRLTPVDIGNTQVDEIFSYTVSNDAPASYPLGDPQLRRRSQLLILHRQVWMLVLIPFWKLLRAQALPLLQHIVSATFVTVETLKWNIALNWTSTL